MSPELQRSTANALITFGLTVALIGVVMASKMIGELSVKPIDNSLAMDRELSRLRRDYDSLRSDTDRMILGPERRFMGTVHRPRKGSHVEHCVWCDGTTDQVADIETQPGQFFASAPVCEACAADPPSYAPRVSYTRRHSERGSIGPRRNPHGGQDVSAEFSDVQAWRKPIHHNPSN